MIDLNRLYNAVLTGNLNEAVEITQCAIEESIDPQVIINQYMSGAMEEIGTRFEKGEAFIPELLMSARALKGALDLLNPLLQEGSATRLGTVVIGTVKGDLHDIGKNLVASMLEGCGFKVINLGIDIPSDQFVSAVKEHNADILCLSALLTTTMGYMQEIITALQDSGVRESVKVMVGGAPISDAYAQQIGADGYSDNANSAVMLAKRLISA